MRGIEPPSQAWEAGILPMNYIRIFCRAESISQDISPCKTQVFCISHPSRIVHKYAFIFVERKLKIIFRQRTLNYGKRKEESR